MKLTNLSIFNETPIISQILVHLQTTKQLNEINCAVDHKMEEYIPNIEYQTTYGYKYNNPALNGDDFINSEQMPAVTMNNHKDGYNE